MIYNGEERLKRLTGQIGVKRKIQRMRLTFTIPHLYNHKDCL
ncbi:hypothetical protein BAOM_5128 [Peribacillus asahii]|uniref:Uncharacterized protein n=1 Tax=Peribacillus asahii TaxID=228899 RepID=A0A3T0KZF2_9BACI|nr:hypothetical protein BAOM_5128 [Peribacillus asahii]